jgi:RNA processing factor Prp31
MDDFKDLREMHLSQTRKKLSVVSEDSLIIGSVRALDDIFRVVKILENRYIEFDDVDFRKQIDCLKRFQGKLDLKLLSLMGKRYSHLVSVAGHVIGARLISSAGSLEKLARMPSSKIQVLGAEKALFRHLKTGSNPPKYGIVYFHDSVMNSQDKGKAARHLASKIAIAARQDFY